MDDLNGLDWSASSNSKATAPQGTGNYYSSVPSLRPTPLPQTSGRATPLSNQLSGHPKPFAPPKSTTPDSFSNLVSFGSSKNNKRTLQEQQEVLQAEKWKQEAERKKQYDTQFGGDQFWDGLGNRGATNTPPRTSRSTTAVTNSLPTNIASAPSPATNGRGLPAEDDLLTAFNKNTQVNTSSHFPPQSEVNSGEITTGFRNKGLDLSQPQAWAQPSSGSSGNTFGDDDDPFGLGTMKQSSMRAPPIPPADDDDFLGDLGKPVEEVRRASPVVKEASTLAGQDSHDPWDKAVAELVDMGFSAEQSRRALTESGSGLDTQAAVSWLLDDSHKQSKQKRIVRDNSRNTRPSNGRRGVIAREGGEKEATPAWMLEERASSQSRQENNHSPSTEVDLPNTAAAVGSNLFKTANSLWKTSQKKVQRVVADLQQDSDSNQPKWMREAVEQEATKRKTVAEGRGRKSPTLTAPEVTDEALMLEGGGRPPPRISKAKNPEPRFPSESTNFHDQSPAVPQRPVSRASPVPRWQQSATADPRLRISKQAIEEQSAQAYVSPTRRKKAAVQIQQVPSPSEPDLLLSSSSAPSQPRSAPTRTSQRPSPVASKPSTPIPTRPKVSQRQIPVISPSALQVSTHHRIAGNQHFKRGDYASAHQSYSSSLSPLPENHPITIILLCNRALTGLKTGVPKEAVTDAGAALSLIDLSRGDGETIDLGPGEGGGIKNMKEFYGKALMRKAEALEQMEKWQDAFTVWKLAVENSIGGANAIQGRARCERAQTPKPVTRVATQQARPKPMPRPRASALGDLAGTGSGDSIAVKRLRDANIAAEKVDDEKFALSDKVDEKVGCWRDGKRDNLRALLGSLDNVMWEGAGWNKVGMHELVQNNRVKIHYMKAIGKCHPDKLPQDSITEVRMLAALVFATLNESWDKFKQQNGL